jgi:hypothetical protein
LKGPIGEFAKNEKPRAISLDSSNDRINFIQQLDTKVGKRHVLIVRHVTADRVGAGLLRLGSQGYQHTDQYLRHHHRITFKLLCVSLAT